MAQAVSGRSLSAVNGRRLSDCIFLRHRDSFERTDMEHQRTAAVVTPQSRRADRLGRQAIPAPRAGGPAAQRLAIVQDMVDASPRVRRQAALAALPDAARPAGGGAPVQRVEIEETEINSRAGNAIDSLETNGFFAGDNDAEEQLIDEYLVRHPKAEFSSDELWKMDMKLRRFLIDGMNMINEQGLFNYNWQTDNWSMPPQWSEVHTKEGGRAQAAAFQPGAGQSRLTAVRALFEAPLEDGETYYADCSSAILSVHYRAIAEAMELNRAGSFDQKFGRDKVVVTSTGVTEVTLAGKPANPPGADLAADVNGLKKPEQLLPGDWVYFQNFSDYKSTHEGAQAAWAGEHAIYMGNDRFRGFGTDAVTYEGMVELLINSYNRQGLKKGAKQKASDEREEMRKAMYGELPGITDVRRAKRPF